MDVAENETKKRTIGSLDESKFDETDHKPEPISLEELRDKMREREKLSKPLFHSKEQRQASALKKIEEEAKKRQEKLFELQKQRESTFPQKSDFKRFERRDDVVHADISAPELEKIKTKYLGAKPVKKKVLKPSEKFKFTFAWEATEDTSPDTNPLYDKPYEAQLLFGRGFRAGIDSREQITRQIDYEEISKERVKELTAKDKEEKKKREKDGVREQKEKEERVRRKQRQDERLRGLIDELANDDVDVVDDLVTEKEAEVSTTTTTTTSDELLVEFSTESKEDATAAESIQI